MSGSRISESGEWSFLANNQYKTSASNKLTLINYNGRKKSYIKFVRYLGTI